MSSPRQPAPSALLASALLVASLAFAHAFPSKAWPSAGLGVAAVNGLLLVWGTALLMKRKLSVAPAPVLLAIAWLVWSWLGIFRMPVPSAASETISRIFSGYVAFLVVLLWMAIARDEEHTAEGGCGTQSQTAGVIVAGLASIIAVMAIHAIWQRFFGYQESLRLLEGNPGAYDPVMLDAMRFELERRAPGSTFGDANTCAALMALAIGLFCGFAAARMTVARMAACAIGVLLCLFAAILTQSRGGVLTVVLAFVLGGVLLWKNLSRHAGTRQRRWIFASIVTAAILAIAAISIILAGTSLGQEWRRRLMASTTVAQRVYYLQSAYRMWIEHPLAGNGPGGFPLHYAQHRMQGSGEAADPHNWLARIAAEQGLIGVVIFAAWLCAALMTLRKRGDQPSVVLLQYAAACGVVLLLFNGLHQHAFATREVYVDFAVLLGVVAGGRNLRREADKADATGRRLESLGHPWGRLSSPPLAAIATLIALILSWPVLIRPDLVRMYLDRSRDKSVDAAYYRSSGDPRLASLLAEGALADANRALSLEPRNPWTLSFKASLVFGTPEIADYSQALVLAQKAVELHPLSASIRDSLAMMHVALKQPQQALAIWERAIALHPLDEELYAHRAEVYAAQGDWQKALSDAYHAATLTKRFHKGYWKAYFDLVRRSGGQRAKEDPGVKEPQ